ncbi:MAG: hypothetical protein GFH27_549309n96 [Chloroflexi bacterium AL-W]|nr:hypothetical protein [Chloroflexi bacterium AL-N1]NOK69798.1 hypothetical protein [Chloroflexi bacterium AL-N10]NOK73598.1 hypothetical protein [Chloroflexi bacterium AL-N5]NOK83968.1 hypothetical protein [Chloroflexi bacterium AL-W]NOK87929.1 hypothetical protein [Chloroflexi bacterium AL-N15]
MSIRRHSFKKRVLLLVILLFMTACGEITNEQIEIPTIVNSDGSVSVVDPTVSDQAFETVDIAEVCLLLPTEEPDPEMMTVNVYFACTHDSLPRALYPFSREVPKDASTQEQLHLSIDALLAGPTEMEREADFTSVFSLITANALNSITWGEDGTATVDLVNLAYLIPNASASAMHGEIIRPLNQTLFQFERVKRIDYRFDGSCMTFAEVFQTTPCQYRTRAGW